MSNSGNPFDQKQGNDRTIIRVNPRGQPPAPAAPQPGNDAAVKPAPASPQLPPGGGSGRRPPVASGGPDSGDDWIRAEARAPVAPIAGNSLPEINLHDLPARCSFFWAVSARRSCVHLLQV
jgi:hypothetical protein